MRETDHSLSASPGFTLIELLVSMAIASIIMAAIASAYWIQTQTSREQQMVVGMQQSLRAALYFLERDIMLAGYDNDRDDPPSATITAATPVQFRFEYIDDTNTQVTVDYSMYDALSDGDQDLGRDVVSDGLPRAAVAENIERLEFFYTLRDGTQTPLPADPGDVRVVNVSILARTASETRRIDNAVYRPLSNASSGTTWGPFNDGFARQLVTASIMCRNMGN